MQEVAGRQGRRLDEGPERIQLLHRPLGVPVAEDDLRAVLLPGPAAGQPGPDRPHHLGDYDVPGVDAGLETRQVAPESSATILLSLRPHFP